MIDRRRASLAIAVVTVVACSRRDDTPAATGAGSAAMVASGSARVAAAPALDTVDGLWAAYKAAHAGATTGNVFDTGRAIWVLLAPDAQGMVNGVAREMIDKLGRGTGAITIEQLAYKVLGETAAARAKDIATATPHVEMAGSDHATVSVVVGKDSLAFEATRGATGWRLAAGPSLVVDYSAVFKAPASGSAAPAGSPTPDALLARWRTTLERGNGWDAYNLLSPVNRTKLDGLIAQMGGSGADDIVKVLEKTIVDRRTAGIAITSATIEAREAASATISLTYSNGQGDRFPAVRIDGVWWLEMPI
jgi:hypothetical protein